jgi:ribonucleoside-diphosphate reductase alpha chain/ribonucleoside-triphosphate reductase
VNAIIVNYNNVRPFNEPLKTFGGFASGHTALQTMIDKISKVLLKENETKKKLKPIDCMDIANIIAEGIVVGGTRRSAESCLVSHDDKETQEAKLKLYTQDDDNNWVVDQNILHRMMSNNSTAYWSKPSYEELKLRFEIIKRSAENNFFNMESATKRKLNVKGTNPLTL